MLSDISKLLGLEWLQELLAKGLSEAETKPRSPPREATSKHGRCGDRGTHAQVPRPRPAGRRPGPPRALSQAPGPILGSSTHQELEHVVGEEGAKLGFNSLGRSYPASPGARGGTGRRLPGHAPPHRPQLTRKPLAVSPLPLADRPGITA